MHQQRLAALDDRAERIEIDAVAALVAAAAGTVIAGALRPIFARIVQRLAELVPDIGARILLARAAIGFEFDQHAGLPLLDEIGTLAEIDHGRRAAEHVAAIDRRGQRTRHAADARDGNQRRMRIDRIGDIERRAVQRLVRRGVVGLGDEIDLGDAKIGPRHHQPRRHRLAVGVDDLGARRGGQVGADLRDLAVLDQHVGVGERACSADGVDVPMLDKDAVQS